MINTLNRKTGNIVLILFILGLLSITVGVSVAFFNYTRTGNNNLLQVGTIRFSSDYESIDLSNIFPIKRENVDTDTNNVGIINVSIEGYTTYEEGLKYTVTAENVNAKVGNKDIPIGVKVTTTDLPSPIVVEYENKDIFENGSVIVRGEIPANTEVDGIITIKAFIDIDHVGISDTYDGGESDEMGTTYEWAKDRVILTTEEWNHFNETPFSFKIKVETVEKDQPVRQVNTMHVFGFPMGNIYGTDYIYDEETGRFTLLGTVEEIEYDSSNPGRVIGKYTCEIDIDGYDIRNNSGSGGAVSYNYDKPKVQFLKGGGASDTCSNLYYINGTDNTEELYYHVRYLYGESLETISVSEFLGKNYYYGTGYNEESDGYTLSGTINNILVNEDNKNSIVGKYTCMSTSQDAECDDMIFINGIFSEDAIKIIEKSHGESGISQDKNAIGLLKPKVYKLSTISEYSSFIYAINLLGSNFAYGTSYEEIGDNFVLSGTIENIEYNMTNKNSIIGKYTCFKNNGSASCDKVIYLDSYLPKLTVNVYNGTIEEDIPPKRQAGVSNISCFSYEENDTGLTITSYNRACERDVVIPIGVNGKRFTKIGNSAFAGREITSIVMPNTIKTIENKAFIYNKLTSVVIPNSVTTIEESAFSNNQLTSVTIGNSVTTIGQFSFEKNELTSVVIPNSVTTIEKSAFSDNQLTSVTIGNSVTTIGQFSFENNQLTNVDIPNSVTMIGYSAFGDNEISSVKIGNGILQTEDSSKPGYMASNAFDWRNVHYFDKAIINDKLFYSFTFNGNLVLGDSVTEIGAYAFEDNKLTSIVISNSVTTIKTRAFAKNTLTNVTIGNGINSMEYGAFFKTGSSNNGLLSIKIDKICSEITQMNNYPWLGSFGYNAGTTIYGANNEVCQTYS